MYTKSRYTNQRLDRNETITWICSYNKNFSKLNFQMKFVFLLALVSVLVLSVTGLDLRGKWKEDQNQRQGLNDFLYEMGKTNYSSFVISDTLNHTAHSSNVALGSI